MRFETITLVAPLVEPVTLDQAKDQLRLTTLQTFDDDYITSLIPVARDRAEKYCNRFFTEQQARLVIYDGWGASSLVLPVPDVASVDSIFYVDSEGTETEITGFSFDSDTCTVYFGSTLPQGASALKVNITTGSPVAFQGVIQSILMIITDMYELRTESVIGASVAENPAVKALLYPYRFNLGI